MNCIPYFRTKHTQWLASNFESGTIDDLLIQDPVAHHQLRNEWERLKIASTAFDQDKYLSIPESLKKLIAFGKLLPASADIHKRGRLCISGAVQRVNTCVVIHERA